MTQETQVQVPQQVPFIVQLQQQLAAFKQQREIAKNNFEQLNGAIFACEHVIKQYEESAKNAVSDLAKKVEENQGGIKDGKTHDKTAKQVAKK